LPSRAGSIQVGRCPKSVRLDALHDSEPRHPVVDASLADLEHSLSDIDES